MPQSKSISVLKKRSEFLAVASCRQRWVTPAFILQIGPRPPQIIQTSSLKGVGFTTSKKMVGIAVRRNRARRRLRALAQAVMEQHAASGFDYVLIAKAEALTRSYSAMKADLEWALKRLKAWQEETP